MRSWIAAALAALALGPSTGAGRPPADACSLVGDTIDVSFLYPDAAHRAHDAGAFVVPSSGIDPSGLAYAAITIGADAITVDYGSSQTFSPASFNGYRLTDLTRSPITKVAVDPGSTVPGVDAGRLTFDGGSIALNLAGLSYVRGQRIRLNVSLSCGPPAVAGPAAAPAA